MCEFSSKLTVVTPERRIVSATLFLTLSRIHTLLYCFHVEFEKVNGGCVVALFLTLNKRNSLISSVLRPAEPQSKIKSLGKIDFV